MSSLKVGVIGVGGIARTHMPGWAASPHAEVIAGADLVPEALDSWGAQWNIGKLETDSAAVINDPDIDVIDVCTPNMYHAPFVHRRAGSGQACDLREAAGADPGRCSAYDRRSRQERARLLMTAQHFRFAASSKALKAKKLKPARWAIFITPAVGCCAGPASLRRLAFLSQQTQPAAAPASISACIFSI